jgi:hypothetical protein
MANNPLDYLIKDPNAMRYALLQDAGYKGGGAVQRFEGGGSARAEDDDAPPPGFRYVYFGDPERGTSGRYPVPIETPTAEPSRDLVGASAAPSLPTAAPELQPEPSTAIAPHRYAPGEVPGGPAPEPTLDQMRYELARSNLTPVDWLAGAGENALSLLTAPLGMLGGYAGLGYHMLRGAPLNEANARAADWARATSYQPTTMAGQEIAEDYVNPVLAKLPPIVSGINARALQVPKGTTGALTAGIKRDINQFSNDVYNAQRGITPGYPTAGTEFSNAFVTPRPTVYDMLAGIEPSNIPSSASAAVMSNPAAPKPAKALAPANEQGFYSPTEAAALNLQRKTGNGQAFLNDLLKQDNVRPDEINAIGLDTFLKDKKNVTAAEVQDYIAQNKLGLGEARYGELSPQEISAEFNRLAEKHYGKTYGELYNNEAESIERMIEPDTSKFSDYALPGGKNYREVVLTLPDPKDALMDQIKALGITKEKNNISINDILQRGGSDELAESWKEAIYKQYTTGHWNEINPIAHLRMSDRVTDGKKTLLVDEVQSDWHQAARDLRTAEVKRLVENGMPKDQAQKAVPKDYGYANPKERQKIVDKLAREEPLTADEEVARRRYLASKNVPDAPYKDDYYQLALRRAIKEAIDGGYDRIALPTGARVAERFSLVNHVDSIDYKLNENGKYRLGVTDKDGFGIDLPQKEYTKEELPGLLGKDVANQLINKEGQWGGGRYTLRGVDLKIGGEGMKKYYDEVYPGYLKNFGKKYGATVGKTSVEVPLKRFVERSADPAKDLTEPLHYMDITPAMRKEFGTGIHMKRGGQVKQPFTPPQYLNYNIDHMRHELMRQG